jgi:seryl-tRNA synthetase
MRFLLGLLLVSFVPAVRAADDENPWKNAKVGDWVEYKMTGTGFEGKTKMTIVAKDEKELSYEVAATFKANGNEMTAPVQKLKIDLTKAYDQKSALNLQNNNTKLEIVDEGKEKLKVGDKEYDTKWTKYKSTTTVNNFTVVTENKMWFSKDVPLSGLVKMDTTVGSTTTKLELTGTGHK